jgi:hypothetical protein
MQEGQDFYCDWSFLGYAATQEVPPQGTPVSVSEAAVEQEKKKTKKRNTINLQLELKKQQAAAAQQQENQQQQQNAALATGAAGMQDMLAQGIVGNPMTNFPNMMIGGAGQQLINQQMYMNSMMFGVPPAGGSQMPMGGNPCMQAQAQLTQGQSKMWFLSFIFHGKIVALSFFFPKSGKEGFKKNCQKLYSSKDTFQIY